MSRIYAASPSPEELAAAKARAGVTISVCLPALNEAATIGDICQKIAPLREVGLVDQLVVVDSGSGDDTPAIAHAAGAQVYEAARLGGPPEAAGKGGTLWKSLTVLSGDIVVWLDSDVRNFEESFVTRLVAPLVEDATIHMSKAFYRRPIEAEGVTDPTGGGRVTELVVRPLVHLLFPELVGFVQPLSGEYASRRTIVSQLSFFSGYGVDIGLLIDMVDRHGPDAVVQVDLGERVHRNQDTLVLGRMASQVMQVMTQRAEDLGRLKLGSTWPPEMTQFVSEQEGPRAVHHLVEVTELPPSREVS